jgi:hypothetical protein
MTKEIKNKIFPLQNKKEISRFVILPPQTKKNTIEDESSTAVFSTEAKN